MPKGVYDRRRKLKRKYTKKSLSANAILIAAGRWCNEERLGFTKGELYTANDLLIFIKKVAAAK